MRAQRGVVQELLEGAQDARRQCVLKQARLLVSDVPLQSERIDEERLGDPVTSQDIDGARTALDREDDTGALSHDVTLRLETAQRSGDRGA